MQYGTSSFRDFPSFRNVLINGDNSVAQKGDGTGFNVDFSIPTLPINCSDMWWLFWAGALTGIMQDQQIADNPILGNTGFSKSITVVNALGGLGVNNYVKTGLSVEGTIFEVIFGLQCILSFQVKSPKTGLHYVNILNDNGNVSFVQQFTVNVANTWEAKIIPVSFANLNAADFGAAPTFSDTPAIHIGFPLQAGANVLTANLGTWQNGLFISGPGQQNLLDTPGNVFRVTDVQLEPGFVATAYDRLPFDIQYSRCQRYWQQTFNYGSRPIQNKGSSQGCIQYSATTAGVSNKYLTIPFSQSLRNTPFITTYNPFALNNKWRNRTLNTDSGVPGFIDTATGSTTILNPQVVGDALANRLAVHATFDQTMIPFA